MKSVVRSFELFELIAQRQPISVAEIASITALPKTTVQRTVGALAEVGWIQKTGTDRVRWKTTVRLLTLARQGSQEVSLREAASASMHQLRDQTGETVQLLIPDGLDRLVCIERVDSTQAVRTFVALGASMPFAATSTGLAILAQLPDEQVDLVLREPIPQYTDKTVTDHNKVREKIEVVRRCGYATNMGQNRTNVCAIGAAIAPSSGNPLGAICVSIPENRFDETRISEWSALVVAAAQDIAERLSAHS